MDRYTTILTTPKLFPLKFERNQFIQTFGKLRTCDPTSQSDCKTIHHRRSNSLRQQALQSSLLIAILQHVMGDCSGSENVNIVPTVSRSSDLSHIVHDAQFSEYFSRYIINCDLPGQSRQWDRLFGLGCLLSEASENTRTSRCLPNILLLGEMTTSTSHDLKLEAECCACVVQCHSVTAALHSLQSILRFTYIYWKLIYLKRKQV
jgi:hypothetical protein